jgi:hypothetical protein
LLNQGSRSVESNSACETHSGGSNRTLSMSF